MNAHQTALISDIHGHYAGLLAVLADARAAGCGRIVCLGDLVDEPISSSADAQRALAGLAAGGGE